MAESSYGVGRPRPSGRGAAREGKAEAQAQAATPELRPRALFIAHGMGQQVPFETMDDVARELCKTIEKDGAEVELREARVVRVECETVQRLELTLKTKGGQDLAPIHLYEAYWAPLTEGAVGLWQVVRFLLSGGWNGLRSDAKLHRYMFGLPRVFPIKRWDIFLLALVILAVIAILIVGTTIGTVGIARFTFDEKGFISVGLVTALTVLFERLLGITAAGAAVAVILIFLARVVMPKDVNIWRYRLAVTLNALAVLPMITIAAAVSFTAYVAIPVLFIIHERPPFPGRECDWCTSASGMFFHDWGMKLAAFGGWIRELVDTVLRCPIPELSAWWFLAGVGIVLVLFAIKSLFTKRTNNGKDRGHGGKYLGLLASLLVLGILLAICGYSDALGFMTWLLLFCAVLFVRSFLIQYIGDVAIYVSPHVVDRFFDLRVRIRETVRRAARAVYACRHQDGSFLYDTVIIAGHSLGSVVVYDVLNRLINEDDLATGITPPCCNGVPVEKFEVEDRTKLLLTFGSPLDKTAFIFARHDPHGGSERDALAASVQPLIEPHEGDDGKKERRFPWINLYSPFDILGGSLQFYDTPDRKNEPQPNVKNRVDNRRDPFAITPLAAHTEFWRNPLLYDVIWSRLKEKA